MDLDELEAVAKSGSRTSSDIEIKECYLLDWLFDTSGAPRWIIDKEA